MGRYFVFVLTLIATRIACVAALFLMCAGCGEDPFKESSEGQAVHKWIHEETEASSYQVIRWWPPIRGDAVRTILLTALNDQVEEERRQILSAETSMERADERMKTIRDRIKSRKKSEGVGVESSEDRVDLADLELWQAAHDSAVADLQDARERLGAVNNRRTVIAENQGLKVVRLKYKPNGEKASDFVFGFGERGAVPFVGDVGDKLKELFPE